MDSTGDDFLRGGSAWFCSGYMLSVSSLAMDEFHICFYDAADSNPEAFSPFGRMEKCAQLMLLVAVLLRAVLTWKTGRNFLSSKWLTPVMMVWFLRRIFMAFFGLLFGVVALPIHPEVLWTYTLAHMSLNNINTPVFSDRRR